MQSQTLNKNIENSVKYNTGKGTGCIKETGEMAQE